MDIDEFEDYLELNDPKVRCEIEKSNEDIRAGRTRPARELMAELRGEKKQNSKDSASESMTTRFAVRTTSGFDRTLRKLSKCHTELADLYEEVVRILETDPYNRSGTHPIKKLVDVRPGDGQYRICAGRFRFDTTLRVRPFT